MGFKTFEQPAAAAAGGGFGSRRGGRPGGDDGSQSILAVLGTLFSFRGRTSRLGYWVTSIGLVFLQITIVVAYTIMTGAGAIGRAQEVPIGLLVIGIPFLWASLAVNVRRLRDRGWSTELIVALYVGSPVVAFVAAISTPLLLVPVVLVNVWAAIECMFFGSAGE